MNREARESIIVSDRAAAALATRVDRDLREERGLWRRYLAFLDGEGFDAHSRMIAERAEVEEVREERLFMLAVVGLLTACLLALAFARTARADVAPANALPTPIEISVAEPASVPDVPST